MQQLELHVPSFSRLVILLLNIAESSRTRKLTSLFKLSRRYTNTPMGFIRLLLKKPVTAFVSATRNMSIKVGDKLPSAELYEGNPDKKVKTTDLFSKGRSIIFGVPGAFTPTCTKSHVPGFVQTADSFKTKGVDTIACVSVNDPFVMEAWGKFLSTDGKVRMLADTNAEFTKKIGMDVDMTAILGSIRSKRYAMVIKDGVVETLNVEPGKGLSCSAAEEVIKLVK